MELDAWLTGYEQRITRRSTQPIFTLIGLFGILTAVFISLVVLYSLTYEFHELVFFLHVQNTVFMFLLATSFIVLSLKGIFLLKRGIWWVWGTQTPNFNPPDHDSIDIDTETIAEARRKGVRWTATGLFIGYLFPLSGIYTETFLEFTFVADYPDIPLLQSALEFVGGLPLFSELEFVTTFFTIIHPVQVLVLGTVLAPLTLGLWNIAYVFSRNHLLLEQVRENPLQTASFYYVFIFFGIAGAGFLIWVA